MPLKTTGIPEDARVVPIPGDGACLFSACFLLLYYEWTGKVADPSSKRFRTAVQRLREETVEYVMQHADWPIGGVRGNSSGREHVAMEYVADPECPEIRDLESYGEHMAKRETFGGQTELQALSGLLNVGIMVHPSGDVEQREIGIYFCSRAAARDVARRLNVGRRPILHILYDEQAQHYSAIISGRPK
jgi:hypothetical protein